MSWLVRSLLLVLADDAPQHAFEGPAHSRGVAVGLGDQLEEFARGGGRRGLVLEISGSQTDRLLELGITLEDVQGGTRWRRRD